MGYLSRLDRAFDAAPVLPLAPQCKYLLISDCHRGNGTSNDNFLKNQNLYFAAAQYYFENGFTYIELGDGDELWENRSMPQIIEIHSNVFWLLSKFLEENRLFMLYGNHDICKRRTGYAQDYYSTYYCPDCRAHRPLMPGLTFHQGLILEGNGTVPSLYLTHGHQADPLNSVFWRLSRFLVRYLWKPAEHIGFLDPTSAARNNTKKDVVEKKLTKWALDNRRLLVTGHTHRPMLGTPSSPYFNTGSCVHPRCITCIEIEGLHITLVKWTLRTREDMTLYVAREELAEPVMLTDFLYEG